MLRSMMQQLNALTHSDGRQVTWEIKLIPEQCSPIMTTTVSAISYDNLNLKDWQTTIYITYMVVKLESELHGTTRGRL